MKVKGKRFLVVGFGLSGEAAARLLVQQGAKVWVIDEAEDKEMKRRARRKKNLGIQARFGVAEVPKENFDAVVVSPGVSPRFGMGQQVAQLDLPVFGELELGSWFCSCPIVAVTGTNGKTTTTELIHRVIRANRKRALAAGNIGLPLSEAVLESDRMDYLVVEVSSFQLETIDSFHPCVSVMMNITPDHLDRYASIEDYARTKAALWKNQDAEDVAVINVETEKYLKALGCVSGSRMLRYSIHGEPADLWFDGNGIRGSIVERAGLDTRLEGTRLRGPHNAENIMAALLVVHGLGLDLARAWKAICEYHPLEHRLQTVGMVRGVEFVNDSKATNVDAMVKAIQSFNRPIVLIAGGKDKGFDFDEARPVLQERVKGCVLIGETRQRIYESWKDTVSCSFAGSLPEAVQMAAKLADAGDVVLLSPACSSYDMFDNYKQRGEVFCRTVQALLNSSMDSLNQTIPLPE
jgi:UDP-N-acetylmuramoylalanine--D-glutamate ligase